MKRLAALGRYRKTTASLIGSWLGWVGVAYVPDGVVSRTEWFALAVTTAGVFGVYAIANDAPQTGA